MIKEDMNDALTFVPVAQCVAGLGLLFFGQRLFWVFVAAVGFFAGVEFAATLFRGWPEWQIFLAALGTAVIGAALAVALQRLAVILAGAFVGGLLAMRIAPDLGLHTDAALLVTFVAGALLVAVLMAVLFDPAVILVSAVAGAVILVDALEVDSVLAAPLGIALAVIGGWLQARRLRRSTGQT